MKDIIIAGGGLAGAAAACLLARAGRRVRLIEREERAKHKVCGEFLSYEAQHYLAQLGLDLPALGAVPISHVRLARGDQVTTAPLPFRGLSLSRRVLDEALLRQAASFGAEVLRGHVIRDITLADVSSLTVDDLGKLSAEVLFLANGKHDVRGVSRKEQSRSCHLVGLKTYFALMPLQERALARHVEIVLFDGGYAGLQSVEGRRANLCLLVRRKRFAQADHNWQELLAGLQDENAHLRERLAGAIEQLDRPLAISRLPYGFLHCAGPSAPRAVFRLGDQMAVTPSFTGDGMSIALHTAFHAVETYLDGGDAAIYHSRMRLEIGAQMRRASVLSNCALTKYGQAILMSAVNIMPSLLSGVAARTRLSATGPITEAVK